MTALAFAWRSLVRQPARASLGVLGVAAVGALLLDMLLLSEGLVISMRDLLDRSGFDLRVTASGDIPGRGPRIRGGAQAADAIAALPSVRAAVAIRIADARLERPDGTTMEVTLQGISGGPARPLTVLTGRDAREAGDVLVNETLARQSGLSPGSPLRLRASCTSGAEFLPPVTLIVAGTAEFPFETPGEAIAAGSLATLEGACASADPGEADLVLVTSGGDAAAAAAAIHAIRPELRTVTNEELIGQFQARGFTYFRQIAAVLTTVTITFALLLITVLLTVSVNQRLGEIAALRALGLSRRRVVSDVLCESVLLVGLGGLLSLPLGILLARWLDAILKRMPGIPVEMHFFVFDPGALAVHALLLAITALAAALYPMHLVARLPIVATLRNEVIS